MEQHPIPQDITGFKFKLVGDMTLQQFGYLAFGAILAYLSFASKFPFLIKWPLVFLFGFGGFALAFLPVEERPLDRWIVSFLKTIYSPTQYLWQKRGALPSFFETQYLSGKITTEVLISTFSGDRQRLEEYLKNLPKTPSSNIDIYENNFLQNLQVLAVGKTPVFPRGEKFKVAPPVSADKIKPGQRIEERPIPRDPLKPEKEIKIEIQKGIPTQPGFSIIAGRIVKQEPPKQTPPPYMHKGSQTPGLNPRANPLDKLQYKNEILEKQALGLKEALGKLKQSPVFTIEDLSKLKELAQKLSEVENQRNKAQEDLLRLKQQFEEIRQTGVKPVMEEIQTRHSPRVKFVSEKQAKNVGLPNPPQTPNILAGLVINQNGEILPGVIIVIKDLEDNPVRAVKTNKLGQFSISTPLSNSVYNLELEKEGYNFDIIEIEAKGEIILPIEIKAK